MDWQRKHRKRPGEVNSGNYVAEGRRACSKAFQILADFVMIQGTSAKRALTRTEAPSIKYHKPHKR